MSFENTFPSVNNQCTKNLTLPTWDKNHGQLHCTLGCSSVRIFETRVIIPQINDMKKPVQL